MDVLQLNNKKDDEILLESVLGKNYKILDENAKMNKVDRIVTKLFKSIRDKTIRIDFSEIDLSKGNVKNLKNYKDIKNAINFLKKLLLKDNYSLKGNKDFAKVINSFETCISILEKYTKEFSSAYLVKNTVIMYIYEGICVSLIEGVSYVISTSIEIVKTSVGCSQGVKQNKDLMKNNFVKSVIKFNELEKKNKLGKAITELQNLKESITAVITGVFTVITLAGLVLLIVRTAIFMFYNTRINLTRYLESIRQYVLLNSTTVTDKKVKEKQIKIATKLKKLSDMISVDQNVANDRSNGDIDSNNKEIGTDDESTNGNDKKDDSDIDIY